MFWLEENSFNSKLQNKLFKESWIVKGEIRYLQLRNINGLFCASEVKSNHLNLKLILIGIFNLQCPITYLILILLPEVKKIKMFLMVFLTYFLRTINFHLSLRNYHALIIFRSYFKDILKLKQQTLINKLVPVYDTNRILLVN